MWDGIIGKDDRQAADSAATPWRSVGRINHAGFRDLAHCTGTLIAPAAVATAAHCFFHPRSHQRLPLGGFRFVLGYQRGAYLELGRVKCVSIHPAFDPEKRASLHSVSEDVAVAILDRPMAETPIELAADEAVKQGVTVSHAGYGRDRPNILSVHPGCRITALHDGGAITDCDTTFGQSGGPVLIEQQGNYRLAGTMSGFIEDRGSVMVPVVQLRTLLEKTSCPQ